MVKSSPSWLAYVATVLAVVSILWTAAEQWGDMKARIKALEAKQTFLHGDFPLPASKKE